MIRRLLRALTTDVDGLRARIAYLERENARLAEQRDRERAAAADAEMSAAIGESVIAALHGEPVSDFAESFGPVMEAQTLRLTLDLVRGDNEALWRVVRDACAYLHVTDDDEADWPKLPAYAKQAAEDADRLRALAGNTAATPAEAALLADGARMNPAHIDPETTWQERPDGLIRGMGDGYTVTVCEAGYLLVADGRTYRNDKLDSLADAVTEARDIRRLVMGC